MSLLMVVFIFALALVLFGVGVYIGIQKRNDDEQPTNHVENSGEFSQIRNSLAKQIRKIKATTEEVIAEITSQYPNIDEITKNQLAQTWEASIQASILMVEAGDRQGFSTYSYEISDKGLEICRILHKDSYITREMIFNHPELLPPFYIGCKARLISREARNNQDKSRWIPVLPVDGAYQVPDWRQIETKIATQATN